MYEMCRSPDRQWCSRAGKVSKADSQEGTWLDMYMQFDTDYRWTTS